MLKVKHHHGLQNHGGKNQTLAALSAHYWIVSAREEIRKYENECRVCRKQKAKAGGQIMCNIPEHRLEKSLHEFNHQR